MSTYEFILLAKQGDKDALGILIKKFNPLLLKFSKNFSYNEIQTDLVIIFIEIIKKINVESLKHLSEAQIVLYIYASVKNGFIDLYRKNKKKTIDIYYTNSIEIEHSPIYEAIDSTIFIYELLDKSNITNKQRIFIIEKYIFNKTELEIANKFNLTPQSVNTTIHRGLKKLKSFIINNSNSWL